MAARPASPRPPPQPAERPRTDEILSVIASELDRHPELEADYTLRTISLVVVLHERTGQPVRILLRTEGQRDLHDDSRRHLEQIPR